MAGRRVVAVGVGAVRGGWPLGLRSGLRPSGAVAALCTSSSPRFGVGAGAYGGRRSGASIRGRSLCSAAATDGQGLVGDDGAAAAVPTETETIKVRPVRFIETEILPPQM